MRESGDDGTSDLLPAERGVGPLLQRDYWAVLAGARLRPTQIMESVRAHFASFAPAELAAFHASCGERGLDVGDELDIHIAGAGDCRVRVVHRDAQSLTLATLEGHPEAGRITFGAYRNHAAEVVFHIRSRARSDSLTRLLGFLVVGEAMQTNTWTQFISRVAALSGGKVDGFVHAGMERLEHRFESPEVPTFIARGD
jgi:hypothetical protein